MLKAITLISIAFTALLVHLIALRYYYLILVTEGSLCHFIYILPVISELNNVVMMLLVVLPSGTFPIDLTKTRLQVQGQSQYMEVRYRGMFHALFKIGKEEGIKALYSG